MCIFPACHVTVKEKQMPLRAVSPSQPAFERSSVLLLAAIRTDPAPVKRGVHWGSAGLPETCCCRQVLGCSREPSYNRGGRWCSHTGRAHPGQPGLGVPVAGREASSPTVLSGLFRTRSLRAQLTSRSCSCPTLSLPPFVPLSCPFPFRVFFPHSVLPPLAPSPPVNMLHLISCCDTISGT